MAKWEEIRESKDALVKNAFLGMTKEEQRIFLEVLRLEIENRHLKAPRVKQPLRAFVSQVIR